MMVSKRIRTPAAEEGKRSSMSAIFTGIIGLTRLFNILKIQEIIKIFHKYNGLKKCKRVKISFPPMQGVSRMKRMDSSFQCCINDGSRSTAYGVQTEYANHLKMLYSKDMVLNVQAKGVCKDIR